MADGSNTQSTKPVSLTEAQVEQLYQKLLAMLSLAEVIQAAATGDMDIRDSGIYGTAAVLEQQANEAIEVLGI